MPNAETLLKPKTAAGYFVAICRGELPRRDPWELHNPTEIRFRQLCLTANHPSDQLKLVLDHTRGTLSFRHFLQTNGIDMHLAAPDGGQFNHDPASPFREWPRELGITDRKFGPFSARGDDQLEESRLAVELDVMACLFQDRHPRSYQTYLAIRGRFETWLDEFKTCYQRPTRVTLADLERALQRRSVLARIKDKEAMDKSRKVIGQFVTP